MYKKCLEISVSPTNQRDITRYLAHTSFTSGSGSPRWTEALSSYWVAGDFAFTVTKMLAIVSKHPRWTFYQGKRNAETLTTWTSTDTANMGLMIEFPQDSGPNSKVGGSNEICWLEEENFGIPRNQLHFIHDFILRF